MGQGTPGGMGKQGGTPGERKSGGDGDKKERKFEPPAAPSGEKVTGGGGVHHAMEHRP